MWKICKKRHLVIRWSIKLHENLQIQDSLMRCHDLQEAEMLYVAYILYPFLFYSFSLIFIDLIERIFHSYFHYIVKQ